MGGMAQEEKCEPCNMWIVDNDLANAITTISCTFDVISFFLICIVFALSFMQVKQRFHAGPRIFAINLMAFNLLCTACSFLENLRLSNVNVLMYLHRIATKNSFVSTVIHNTEFVRSLALLVFNTSYIPILVMFTLAFLRPFQPSSISVTKQFLVLVVLSDAIPIAIQIVNLPSLHYTQSWYSVMYGIAIYVLYMIQLSATAAAVFVIYARTKELSLVSGNQQAATRRRELIRVLYFAVGPSIMHLPFAFILLFKHIQNYVLFPQWFNQVVGNSFLFVRIIVSMKPTVDAISVMLFLGEYRHNVLAILLSICRNADRALTAIGYKRVSDTAPLYQVQYTSAILRSTTSSSPSLVEHVASDERLPPVG